MGEAAGYGSKKRRYAGNVEEAKARWKRDRTGKHNGEKGDMMVEGREEEAIGGKERKEAEEEEVKEGDLPAGRQGKEKSRGRIKGGGEIM